MKKTLIVLLLGVVIVSDYRWECQSYFNKCKCACDENDECSAIECDIVYTCTQYATLIDSDRGIALFSVQTDSKSDITEAEMKKLKGEQ